VIANLKYRFSEKNLSMACLVYKFMSLNYDGSSDVYRGSSRPEPIEKFRLN
jgi:hypothetical protein